MQLDITPFYSQESKGLVLKNGLNFIYFHQNSLSSPPAKISFRYFIHQSSPQQNLHREVQFPKRDQKNQKPITNEEYVAGNKHEVKSIATVSLQSQSAITWIASVVLHL